MTTREHMTNMGFVQTQGPVTLAASANGASVDTLGYDSATILISAGIGGITFDTNNKIDFKIEHSQDGSTWSGVAQSDIQAAPGAAIVVGAGGIVRSLTAAKAAADVKPTKVAYVGSARYLRTPVTFTGTHGSGTLISCGVALGHSHIKPVA